MGFPQKKSPPGGGCKDGPFRFVGCPRVMDSATSLRCARNDIFLRRCLSADWSRDVLCHVQEKSGREALTRCKQNDLGDKTLKRPKKISSGRYRGQTR